MNAPQQTGLAAPLVGCVVLRRLGNSEEVLMGRYSPEHEKEYLRGLLCVPGGKHELLPPIHRLIPVSSGSVSSGFWCVDCEESDPVRPYCAGHKRFETALEAGLREMEEETGARPSDLRPVAHEWFRTGIYGHGYEGGVDAVAILFEASSAFRPCDQPGERGRTEGWRWHDTRRLPPRLRISPLSVLCLGRFAL